MTNTEIVTLARHTVNDLREFLAEHEIEEGAVNYRIRQVAEDVGMSRPTDADCDNVRDTIRVVVG